MAENRVLIVEDDLLVAVDIEQALLEAGYEVCAVARSEAEALALAERLRPELAIVDIALSPGDGRVVAQTLCRAYRTAVLFTTGQCNDVKSLRGTGAMACLPKPYSSTDLPTALAAVRRMQDGDLTTPLPDQMIVLAA